MKVNDNLYSAFSSEHIFHLRDAALVLLLICFVHHFQPRKRRPPPLPAPTLCPAVSASNAATKCPAGKGFIRKIDLRVQADDKTIILTFETVLTFSELPSK